MTIKANLIVAEMDPSRIGVACRAVTHELIPRFQAQRGAHRGYWMVKRTTGEVLVVTTWEDEDALEAARAADGAHRANVAERTGLGIRDVQTMDVLESGDAGSTPTTAARWVSAMWFDAPRSDRSAVLAAEHRAAVAGERGSAGFCGSCWLADLATGAGLALSFWERPAGTPGWRRALPRGLGPTVTRGAEFESLGVDAPRRAHPAPPTC